MSRYDGDELSKGDLPSIAYAPGKHGLIPEKYVGALQRLRANLDKPGI